MTDHLLIFPSLLCYHSKFKVAVELVQREQATLRDVLVYLRELLAKVSDNEKKASKKAGKNAKKAVEDEEEEEEEL